MEAFSFLRRPPDFLYSLIFQRLDRKPGNLNDGSLCHLHIHCLVLDSYDLAIDTAAKHHLAANLQLCVPQQARHGASLPFLRK